MELKRVVVTGLGALTPLGNTVAEYWNGLVNGVSGAELITRFDTSKFKTRFACTLKGYDPLNFFDRKEVRKYDPCTQFGLVAADHAIKDSGLDLERDQHRPCWRDLGFWHRGLDTFLEEIVAFGRGDGTPRFSPFFIPKMIADMTAGSYIHQIWIQRTQFCHCFSMALRSQCHGGCHELYPAW